MNVRLDFGRTGVEVDLPSNHEITVVAARRHRPIADPHTAVREALFRPIESPPLVTVARGRKKGVIVVSDKTRPVPYKIILPALLETLHAAGLQPEQLEIVVATGLHRPNSPSELEEMLGAQVVRHYAVRNHVARDDAAHGFLGTTSRGTEIWIDRGYLQPDLRILTGLIEPHLMAGYSGGRKALCPGLAGVRTMRSAHGPEMLEGSVGPGILDGNPFHADLLEIVSRVGADFLCDVTIDRNRQLTGVYAGHVIAAHLAGARAVESQVSVSLPEAVDIVITSGGGYPLDQTLYQSIKGLVGALNIVRTGGAILLVAELAEGAGSAEFVRLLAAADSPAAFMGQLRRPDFFHIDQWMVQHLCQVLRKASVWIVAPRQVVEFRPGFAVRWASSVDAALQEAFDVVGGHATIAVVPEGPYTLPTVRGRKLAIGSAWRETDAARQAEEPTF